MLYEYDYNQVNEKFVLKRISYLTGLGFYTPLTEIENNHNNNYMNEKTT